MHPNDPITPREWASAVVGLLALAVLFVAAGTLESADAREVTPQYRAKVIRKVFGPRYGGEAVRVARCESGLRPWARNGQYRGLFQMGTAERKRYGHGSGAWMQARAARRYFVASGRDWSPWDRKCRP